MKRNLDITTCRILGLAMFFGILFLTMLIYRDFTSDLYEEWGRALANTLQNFASDTAGK